QIRKFFFAVIHSMTIALPAWRKACVANNLPICLILCDVKTCWNSTFDMVKMALKYCAAVDDITANKGLKLHKYELDDDDWDIVLDLLHLLKDVTLFFSQDTISTIMHVIPTMDRIDALLNNTAAEPLSLSVKHVLAFARQIINRYYSKTD
ncbi:hypothetical protein BC827DRAFT_1093543, partial [Russula dissimulans]